MFKTGSLVYVDAQAFLQFSKAKADGKEDAIKEAATNLEYHILFEPTKTTSYVGYSTTKNYLILYMLDDVKEKIQVNKLGEGGGAFQLESGDQEGGMLSLSLSGIDSRDSDLLWYTTSSYLQPSTLHIADVSKYGEDDFVIDKLKSLPDMVRGIFLSSFIIDTLILLT